MIITFVGHSIIPSRGKVKELVKEQIRNIIISENHVTFYLGGYGAFDEICAFVCRELKKEYSNIEIVYVTPYINDSQKSKIKEMQNCGLCDTSLYPPLENVPPKFAISRRNEWMITNADLIIAYVNQNSGGAYNSLQIAKRKKKKILNICDFI